MRNKDRKFRRRGIQVLFCAANCKYASVREAARSFGWKVVEEGGSQESRPRCHVCWVDVANIIERMQQIQSWQRINHFPGMSNLARKSRLAQNLEHMRRVFPADFQFYPRTWVLPGDWSSFKQEFNASGKSNKTFIIKPDSGCQGRGIYLTQDLSRVDSLESQVAQVYVCKPLLIDHLKFDLRVYVLLSSVRPFKLYIFRDGLVRMCTEKYVWPSPDNMGDRCMHLTNYSINKKSEAFVANEDAERSDTGSKRSLKWLLEWVAEKYGTAKSELLWQKIGDCCSKSVVSVLPQLQREYRNVFGDDVFFDRGSGKGGKDKADSIEGSRCIELLGFDFMLDSSLNPWLIEVNHLPSFGTDSPLDKRIKTKVLQTAMSIWGVKASDRACYDKVSRRNSQARLYRSSSSSNSSSNSSSPELLLFHCRKAAGMGTTESAQQKQEAKKVGATVQQALEDIYALHAPEKLSKVPALLRKYEGKERKLLAQVRAKYEANSCRESLWCDMEADDQSCKACKSDVRMSSSEPSSPRKHQDTRPQSHDAQAQAQALGHMIQEPEELPSKTSGEQDEAYAAAQWEGTVDDVQLRWELDQLEGWDRLHPPPHQVPVEAETEVAKGTNRRRRKRGTLQEMLRFVFEEDERKMARLQAPLQQARSSATPQDALDTQETRAGSSSPLPDLWQLRAGGGGGLLMGRAPPKREMKTLPVPGPRQQAKAERLMKGYTSSQRLGVSMIASGADPPKHLQSAIARAKQWRRRLEDIRAKKAAPGIVLKAKLHTLELGSAADQQFHAQSF